MESINAKITQINDTLKSKISKLNLQEVGIILPNREWRPFSKNSSGESSSATKPEVAPTQPEENSAKTCSTVKPEVVPNPSDGKNAAKIPPARPPPPKPQKPRMYPLLDRSSNQFITPEHPIQPEYKRPPSINPFYGDGKNVPMHLNNLSPELTSARHSIAGSEIPQPPIERKLSLPPQPAPRRVNAAPPVKINCLICRDFNAVDAHAAKFPRQSFTSISKLAIALTSPFPSHTDKARAIFIWLHHNIAYNTAAFFSNKVKRQTTKETLKTGLAVCQGYAELFAELCRCSGLEAIVISGHGKGYGFTEIEGNVVPPFTTNHAWNAVRLENGEWHLVDSCWGAGTVDGIAGYKKRLNLNYFLASPEKFRLKHFPTNPKEQFCSTSMSWDEYIMMKKTTPTIYTTFDEKGFSRDTIQPPTKDIPPGPTTFVVTTKCEHVPILPQNQYVLLLRVDGQYIPFQVDPSNRIWTCEYHSLKSGYKVDLYYLEKLDGVDAIGVGLEGFLRAKNRKHMDFQGLCMWEVYSGNDVRHNEFNVF